MQKTRLPTPSHDYSIRSNNISMISGSRTVFCCMPDPSNPKKTPQALPTGTFNKLFCYKSSNKKKKNKQEPGIQDLFWNVRVPCHSRGSYYLRNVAFLSLCSTVLVVTAGIVGCINHIDSIPLQQKISPHGRGRNPFILFLQLDLLQSNHLSCPDILSLVNCAIRLEMNWY